jgi:hypothetical protein
MDLQWIKESGAVADEADSATDDRLRRLNAVMLAAYVATAAAGTVALIMCMRSDKFKPVEHQRRQWTHCLLVLALFSRIPDALLGVLEPNDRYQWTYFLRTIAFPIVLGALSLVVSQWAAVVRPGVTAQARSSNAFVDSSLITINFVHGVRNQ